ncbi:MAG: hypothetical protein RMY33_009290 [Nostoc sp. DedQUE03]|nr:hypothetical protein [Nostoc sp. DedQUE02]
MSNDKPLRVYALFLRFSVRRLHLLFHNSDRFYIKFYENIQVEIFLWMR